MTLPPALRNRYNAQVGAAAELAFIRELARRNPNADIWSVGANSSARHNKDVWGLWDVLASTYSGLIVAQVKATATQPRPDQLWMTRYLAWPHAETTRCLLAWLMPTGQWSVRLLDREGRMEDAGWG